MNAEQALQYYGNSRQLVEATLRALELTEEATFAELDEGGSRLSRVFVSSSDALVVFTMDESGTSMPAEVFAWRSVPPPEIHVRAHGDPWGDNGEPLEFVLSRPSATLGQLDARKAPDGLSEFAASVLRNARGR